MHEIIKDHSNTTLTEVDRDFFMDEVFAPDYVEAAMRSLDRGQSKIHRHDAFELAVRFNIPPAEAILYCFQAMNRALDAKRRAAYLPYDALPEGWVDEF